MNFDEATNPEEDLEQPGISEPDGIKITRNWWNGQVYKTRIERMFITPTDELHESVDNNKSLILLSDGEIYSDDEQPSPQVWCTVHRSAEPHIILRKNAALCRAGHWSCKECAVEIEEDSEDETDEDVFVCYQHADDYLQELEHNDSQSLKTKLLNLGTSIFRPQSSMPRKKRPFPRDQQQVGPGYHGQPKGRNHQSAPGHYQKKR